MLNNLTTLDNVTAWLNPQTTTDNALFTRLIGSASRTILSYIQRPTVFQNTFSETYDGTGTARMVLRNWPVISVSSLIVNTVTVTQAPAYGQSGFILEPWDGYPPGRPQWLNLYGYSFTRANDTRYTNGLGNVQVVYKAGFVIQNEAQTVPASGTYIVTANQPHGTWAVDQGVTYANGTALTLVTGTPSTGQYTAAKGVYTFAAGDASQAVLISYSYIPSDIEQACLEIVGERYRTRDRIGQKSKVLGGQETVSYDTSAMNPYVKTLLQPYKRIILC